ncbi:MAG: RNA 2'-phosphotransferase [Deltaproteobacteria bacterium]|jgi:putative RNA 2'-phosphotransferase
MIGERFNSFDRTAEVGILDEKHRLRSFTLGKKRKDMKTKDLCRLMVYILAHRPDEFGLVPDRDGFIAYKDLLKAFHEEEEWRFVRQSHLNEVLLGEERRLFQAEEKRIRAMDRVWEMDLNVPAESLPKTLFTPVRRKAHAPVMEKGLRPPSNAHVVLTPQREMARRMGHRKDPDPVVLEIRAQYAQQQGMLFFPFGDLFLCDHISPRFIAGPQPPREILEERKAQSKKKETAEKVIAPPTPGTFVLDARRDPDRARSGKKGKGKKPKGWKEAVRKERRRKR